MPLESHSSLCSLQRNINYSNSSLLGAMYPVIPRAGKSASSAEWFTVMHATCIVQAACLCMETGNKPRTSMCSSSHTSYFCLEQTVGKHKLYERFPHFEAKQKGLCLLLSLLAFIYRVMMTLRLMQVSGVWARSLSACTTLKKKAMQSRLRLALYLVGRRVCIPVHVLMDDDRVMKWLWGAKSVKPDDLCVPMSLIPDLGQEGSQKPPLYSVFLM